MVGPWPTAFTANPFPHGRPGPSSDLPSHGPTRRLPSSRPEAQRRRVSRLSRTREERTQRFPALPRSNPPVGRDAPRGRWPGGGRPRPCATVRDGRRAETSPEDWWFEGALLCCFGTSESTLPVRGNYIKCLFWIRYSDRNCAEIVRAPFGHTLRNQTL